MNNRAYIFTACIFLSFAIPPCFAQGPKPEKKMSSKEIKVLVDSVERALNRIYIFPDKAALMIGAVKNSYKKGAYNKALTQHELGMLLQKDIQQAHKDKHLGIFFNPEFAKHLEKTPTPEELEERKKRQLNNARENNFAFQKIEILPGNIGYIRWDGFYEFTEEAKPTLDGALQFISNCKAVILDMRYNGGGSPDMVVAIQNYFFSTKTRMNDIIDRNNDTVKHWADPSKTAFQLTMPVYILTSSNTFSGAEDFTYGLKHAGRGTVVGDTTGGGAHPTGSFSIGQGFVMYIPLARSFNIATRTDWEGTGVWPDVAVPAEQALTKAQFLIFTELLAKAKDEREKNSYKWGLNNLLSETVKIPDPDALKAYCAVYEGGLDFNVKDGRLICKNQERGNAVFELKYIEPDLFVLDENVHVEFQKDTTGLYSILKMRWKSGHISEKRKVDVSEK